MNTKDRTFLLNFFMIVFSLSVFVSVGTSFFPKDFSIGVLIGSAIFTIFFIIYITKRRQ